MGGTRPIRGVDPGSFRDPSGFVYRGEDARLLRQVNACYETQFRMLHSSGLYEALAGDSLLIPHEEVPIEAAASEAARAVIAPRELPFISYPYEWCFSQLRAAALLTLEVQERALEHGMLLKDSSAYNVQFDGPRPIFVDTLSFEPYRAGEPWVAYGQFCRHFLAPLALMAYGAPDLSGLLQSQLDGVSLDTASRILPWRTWARAGLLTHLHLHAGTERRHLMAEKRNGGKQHAAMPAKGVSKTALRAIVDSLASAVRRLPSPRGPSAWDDYYETNTYGDAASEAKRAFVAGALGKLAPPMLWDFGANTGAFSRLAAAHAKTVVSFESDHGCVEENYRQCTQEGAKAVLPLWADLTNPSPALGWAHTERRSLLERGPADTLLALALVHHLAIGNNVPLPMLADFFHAAARQLIVEFVPKEDPQTQRLLAAKTDVFADYTEAHFELALGERFDIVERHALEERGRVLYWMSRRP